MKMLKGAEKNIDEDCAARLWAATKEEPHAEAQRAQRKQNFKQKFREGTKSNEDLFRTAENAEAAEVIFFDFRISVICEIRG